MKKGRIGATFNEEYTKEVRTFPKGKAIWFAVVLLFQIGIIVAAFCYTPKPQDRIQEYKVTVEALENGSLDILYEFVWEALDTWEELTWVEIGMANRHFSVYPDSVSDTIREYSKEDYDGEVYLNLDLDRAYAGGEVVRFSFKINQQAMLCKTTNGFFYEFVPGWFNATPVDHYVFRWAADDRIESAKGAQRYTGYYHWSGQFDCGEYQMMTVEYKADSFENYSLVPYKAFDDSGAYNDLEGGRTGLIILAFIVAAFLIIVQVWIVDSVVSYHRGRGFLSGHGYYMHTYGRPNRFYIRARDRYNETHSATGHYHGHGRGFGGGCACACACACAGGGRAGCSQKDTYAPPSEE